MTPRPSTEKGLLEKLTQITEDNLSNERFGVSELARETGMSRSNLHRWVKSATGSSVSRFIREVRLKKALELLKESSYTVSEVAFRVGFGSATYFSKCFHDYYSYPPGEVGEHMEDDQASQDPIQKTGPGITGKKRMKTPILIFLVALVAFAVILVVILNPFFSPRENPEKSIAVLPFRNDSPEEDKMYFINGTMEAITNNLCKIEDLRVVSRTSVEQYRDHPKPIPVVAEEMNVTYLLEGSGYRDGNNVRLYVQLLDGRKDRHIWSKSYDAEIEEIFFVNSDIAQLVAAEIEAFITPHEKQLIEKIPTTSQTAYDLWQRGNEEYWKYEYGKGNNPESFDRAIGLYRYALEYDSTFASPYIRIAGMHQLRYGTNKLKYAGSLDSSLLYINKGLLLDNQAEEGYFLRGFYYINLGQFDKAIEEFDKAIDINPNYSEAYRGKGYVYATRKVDYIKSIDNFYKSLQLLRGGNLPYALRELKWAYGLAGFIEKSMELEREAFILDGDSLTFLLQRAWYESSVRKDTMAAMETTFKAYAQDSTAIRALLHMGNMYRMLGQYKESYTYYSKCVARMEELNSSLMWAMPNMIYVFQQVGETEKANYFIHKSIQYYESTPGEKRSQLSVIRLAHLRALNGDAEDALELLSNLAQQDCLIPSARSFEESFLWDKIRNEPEFMPIMREINAKRQAEYERVRQWLVENDLL